MSCVRDQVRSPTLRDGGGRPGDAPPYPTNEPMEFGGCVVWDLARRQLAAPSHHLLGGKPDTQVHELNDVGYGMSTTQGRVVGR